MEDRTTNRGSSQIFSEKGKVDMEEPELDKDKEDEVDKIIREHCEKVHQYKREGFDRWCLGQAR
ncbi:MAG TPA: hypothetical protein ENH60_07340 [Pricia sp.]|nr:hypothetical protein [Pricia sp.]